MYMCFIDMDEVVIKYFFGVVHLDFVVKKYFRYMRLGKNKSIINFPYGVIVFIQDIEVGFLADFHVS